MTRTTHVLLFAIALGLFLNAAAAWFPPAHAQDWGGIELSLRRIERNVQAIADGNCVNRKIC